MNMQHFKEQKLANGLTLSFSDCSKCVAADRWLVKMEGEMRIPLANVNWPAGDGDDPALLNMVKERLGESISFILSKERNFIDADKKEEVLTDLVLQVEENLLGYLGDSSFPQKLFAKQYEEMRQRCLLELQQPAASGVDDDDNAPADFSACFRD